MDRRRFLKIAGLSSLTVGLASTAYRLGHWWSQAPADSFDVLSSSEVRITRAIADAIFPGESGLSRGGGGPLPSGGEVEGVVEYLDDYLDMVDDEMSRMIRLLLHTIEDAALFWDWTFKPFHRRSRSERVAVVRAWDESSLPIRRKAFRALKLIIAGGYFQNADVLDRLGVQFRCGG